MTATVRVPRRVRVFRGVKREAGVVYVGRPSPWGNPFATARAFRVWLETGRYHARDVVDRQLDYLGDEDLRIVLQNKRADILARVGTLAGKDLGCWCELTPAGQRDWCHGDILLELANRDLCKKPNQERNQPQMEHR